MARTILVVDDDRDIRDSLIELLETLGNLALGAANGVEALAVLHGAAELPCMILLDLMMPVMDGRGFRAAQLADPALASIPVIVISAYDDAATQARALGVEYLGKPIAVRPMLEAIRRHCAAPSPPEPASPQRAN